MSQEVEFQFRRRYNLPPNDPRYLELTTEEMLVDLLAHRFAEDPNTPDEVEDEGFDIDAMIAQVDAQADADVAGVDDWEPL